MISEQKTTSVLVAESHSLSIGSSTNYSQFITSLTSTMIRLTSIAIVIAIIGHGCETARILGVFPAPSISHQVVFRRVTTELSIRGHELIIFTPDPVKNANLKNYTEYDMHFTYEMMFNVVEHRYSLWDLVKNWNIAMERVTDAILSSPEMKRIIDPNSNEHFDLILVEYFNFDAIYGLMKRFDAPMIGIISMPLLSTGHHAIGNPLGFVYSPDVVTPFTDDMNFWQRLTNVYYNVRFVLMQYYHNLDLQDRLLKKHFGKDMPFAGDLARNVSLVFSNSHSLMSYPRPSLPNVIQIGGISLNRTLRGLDKDLKRFLDGASNGFVYFSLGSNAKSKDLPPNTLHKLITAFKELPYRVLWKWELDALPDKPDNVFISKWLPQYDVLAHKNIKVFVYQGGLQSTEEAIDNAVPLIGIPVFGDQEFNVRKMQAAGLGRRLDFEVFTKDTIKDTIVEVMTDKGYKERMLEFRSILNDQPEQAVDRAIWWTEFVIRHKGAAHLQTRVRHMPWYQRELLDILLFVVTIVLLALYILYSLVKHVIERITGQPSSTVGIKFKIK